MHGGRRAAPLCFPSAGEILAKYPLLLGCAVEFVVQVVFYAAGLWKKTALLLR